MLPGYEIEFDGLLLTIRQNINTMTVEEIDKKIVDYAVRQRIEPENVLAKLNSCLRQHGIKEVSLLKKNFKHQSNI